MSGKLRRYYAERGFVMNEGEPVMLASDVDAWAAEIRVAVQALAVAEDMAALNHVAWRGNPSDENWQAMIGFYERREIAKAKLNELLAPDA